MRLRICLIAAGLIALPTFASAADTRGFSDRDRMKTWSIEKDKLQHSLGIGKDRAQYRQALESMGFWITAVNYDRPDYLEYEIVKGQDTYEVQINFDKDSQKATKVDVTANFWKAEGTERALEQQGYKYQYPSATTPNPDQYSERARSGKWAGEKKELETALGVGQPKSHYRTALEKLGYVVTSVNYDRVDYLEYEVVKDKHSYEVQVDIDAKSGKSTKVDVTTNLWRADATKRALRGK